MIISEKIFVRMKELGMTQQEFAVKTGITPSTISDWKTKKNNPASDKLVTICEALEMTPNELLSGTTSKGGNWTTDHIMIDEGTKDYILIEEFRKLNKSQQERLLGYLDALRKN